ncbi:MAG: phosphoglycerate mutase [Methylococcales symbiont of Hymedesmia sp. n. MRB-2018]|nr:MAG: phosphoglycerate mutase [Methylococcales symbiont of Hymedesmia sp. n. MRB-2018]
MQTTVDFLRHGEVTGGSYYLGSTDDLLSQSGWQQMHNTVANRCWDQIISSPLLRCSKFAHNISQQDNTPLIIEADWQEIHFGDWEGKTATQIDATELLLFYQDPVKYTPKNAEAFAEFIARINLAWEGLLKQHIGKHILVITHGGVIRALFALLLDLPINKLFNLQVDHASLTRFQYFQDKENAFIQLQFHNLNPNKSPLLS